MDRFSQAYEKASDVVKNQTFVDDWQTFLEKEVKIKQLLDATGPDTTHAGGLDKLRKKINDGSGKDGKTAADLILAASQGKTGKLEDRASTIKMLKHLYLSRQQGTQDVWVYAPPVDYQKWIYDEISPPEASMKPKLNKEDEVYSAGERKIMCDALQLALTWTMDAMIKLSDGKDTTLAMVRRWFADEDTTDQQIKDAAKTLNDGYKKIANVAKSNKLIFSDEPNDRNTGGWKDWAFVYKSEGMDVVYLQGAFLKSGNSGKLWMCALTIIHELSHRAVGTSDHAYDSDGLKPSKASLPHAKAIDNADSWAYFATDLAGKLSESDRNKVLT